MTDLDDALEVLAEAATDYLGEKTRAARIEAVAAMSRASARAWRAVRGDADSFSAGLSAAKKSRPRANGKEK